MRFVNVTWYKEPNDKIRAEVECPVCGKLRSLVLTSEQASEIVKDEKCIQDILPYGQYTSDNREMFITGICNDCWEKI